jgi:biotin carboxyl carrier protein
MKGALWILGFALLAGMFVGVKLLFPTSNANQVNPRTGEGNEPPERIVCWGNFDVEEGVALLYPRQFGKVVFIHEESTKSKESGYAKVKEGDLLLQVENSLVKLAVEKAKAQVRAAEQQLAEAKKLPELYKLQKESQQSAIKAAQLEYDKFNADIEAKIAAYGAGNEPVVKKLREFADFGLKGLMIKKKVEEDKLKEIELQDADLKIKQAEADLDAKKLMVQEAEETVKHFEITAPSDGYVLRTHVRKGETLGPNPRVAAIEFLPDAPIIVRAEVLQEWGRYVKPGAEVIIEDDTYKGPEWKGVVKKVSGWYATTRSPIIEPFRYNDVRTLECIIEVEKGGPEMRIGQRVRAKIKMQK